MRQLATFTVDHDVGAQLLQKLCMWAHGFELIIQAAIGQKTAMPAGGELQPCCAKQGG
ncbi:hypothetical protein D3C75_1366860 [compost metagenome]